MNMDPETTFRENDQTRIMGLVGKAVCNVLGVGIINHNSVISKCEQIRQALVGMGESEPADLDTTTDAFVQGVRAGYVAHREQLEAVLALPETLRPFGVSDATLQAEMDNCDTWVAAIDDTWPEAP